MSTNIVGIDPDGELPTPWVDAMTKTLQNSWMVGTTRVTHAGFGIYKLRGHLNLPTDLLSGPLESAQKAIETAETFGDDYAVFRMARSSAGLEAKEMLSRDDLPVYVA
jgi:hypothetical protein